MKIGIIREGKVPPDTRVPITPEQCRFLIEDRGANLVVQSSENRCYSDEEYKNQNVPIVEDVRDCDLLLGVKEVPIPDLIDNKKYFFFSHTIKAQPYNRDLLRAILKRQIDLVDYEVLTNEKGQRLIAFGKFAGMVGAHNALWTYGERTKSQFLPRMKDCKDYASIQEIYNQTTFPPVRIVVTGTGRVANGACKVLDDMGYDRHEAGDFVNSELVGYTQIGVTDYATHRENKSFKEQEYFDHPERFIIDFTKFFSSSDIMINGIYWDPKSPAFFNLEEMSSTAFRIRTIADVTCDIAPESSIPSTIKASTIADPVFGFNPKTGETSDVTDPSGISMMTIDNLPNELPRDASESFGQQFIEHIYPELMREGSTVINGATIAAAGALTPKFAYLKDYVA